MSSCSPVSSGGGRGGARWALGALALLAAASGLAAQQPADTLPVRDTTDATADLLKGQAEARVRLPVVPALGREHLLPPFARLVLNRDSLDIMNAETVGDALATVPGVFLWRGGWLGRPEPANYQGRGATSVEYLVDGVPYLPLGRDTTSVDPSLLPLGFVDRIEVERLPGALRVHLFLREHDVLAPWSRLTVARGTYDQGRYEALLQRRGRTGWGYSVGAAYWISPAFNKDGGDFDNAFGWLEGSYVPRETFGVRLRYRLAEPDRKPALTLTTPQDTLSRPLNGRRSDLEARVFLRGGSGGLGPGADFPVTRTTWRQDSLEQSLWRAGAIFSSRAADRSLGASLWYGSRWTRLDARVNAGWAPVDYFSLAAEGALQRHGDGRAARWLLARAGLSLPYGFWASGSWRTGRIVARPALADDSAQAVSDRELQGGFALGRVAASVGYTRLAAFQPASYFQYVFVDSIARSAPTEWLTVTARVAPRQWLTLEGWHADPLGPGPGPEGTPPTQSRVTLAVQSKFLRTFPSGIFDLKLAVGMETWGTGVLGRDPDGDPVTLPGATLFRGQIQLRFDQFMVYYDRYNLADTRQGYLPGLRLPIGGATFGVRWAFLN